MNPTTVTRAQQQSSPLPTSQQPRQELQSITGNSASAAVSTRIRQQNSRLQSSRQGYGWYRPVVREQRRQHSKQPANTMLPSLYSTRLVFSSHEKRSTEHCGSLSFSSSVDDNDSDDNVERDRREWKAITQALTIYKAAYGDLLVPQRFVVPNLKPWPKSAWGMKLGKVVQAIRSSGSGSGSGTAESKYLQAAPKSRRAWLDQAGFAWHVPSPSSSSSQQKLASTSTTAAAASKKAKTKKIAAKKKKKKPIAPKSPVVEATTTTSPSATAAEGETKTTLNKKAPPKPVTLHSEAGAPVSSGAKEEDGDKATESDLENRWNSNDNADDDERTDWRTTVVDVQKVYDALRVYLDLESERNKGKGTAISIPMDFEVPRNDDSQQWPSTLAGFPLGQQFYALMANDGELLRQSAPELRRKITNLLHEPSSSEQPQPQQQGDETTTTELSKPLTEAVRDENENERRRSEPFSADSTDATSRNANDGTMTDDEGNKEPATPPTLPSSAIMTTNDGGVPSANDLRFEKVYRALATYKQKYGDLLVPQPFVVPSEEDGWEDQPDLWGLRLGARVNAIRSQGTFVNKNPERRQLLDDLGFAWNPPRTESRRQATATKRNKSQHKHNNNKENDGDDGEEDYNYDSFGFGSNTNNGDEEDEDEEDELSSLFDKTFGLLDNQGPGTTKSSGGDDKNSQSTWGFVGGGDLQELALLQQKQMEQLQNKEEAVYTPPRSLSESLAEARERAREVGIVEAGEGRVRKGKREKDIPWFNDDFGDDFVFDDVLEALTLYKSYHGDFSNLTANHDFVVPPPSSSLRTGFLSDDDDDYLDDFGGYREEDDDDLDGGRAARSSLSSFDSDASARAARAIAQYEERGEFDQSQDLIAAEIEKLQRDVSPETATAQIQSPEPYSTLSSMSGSGGRQEWPEHLAGMQLGNIVLRIQDGSLEVRHLNERKAQLDAIGFDWGDDRHFVDIPFEKAMCAFYAYYLVRGDMFVYEDFVMPNEDPWPEALAGYEIGKAVKRIRELQNFLEAYHPEKVSLLRMIDFVWFPTAALPLDPNDELEMDNELLRLTGLGHPDYAIRDIPLGIQEQILADGPFFDTGGDPKLWWREWHNWEYVKDYWYEQGRRDNAFVLRKMGYPKMAAEHEAKYGPGIFEQMEWTLAPLRADENVIQSKSVEERKELLKTLNFFRQEMKDCSDIHRDELVELLEELDEKILEILKESNIEWDEEEDSEDDESRNQTSKQGGSTPREYEEEDENEDEEEDDDDDDDDLLVVEEDYDVDGELGLKSMR